MAKRRTSKNEAVTALIEQLPEQIVEIPVIDVTATEMVSDLEAVVNALEVYDHPAEPVLNDAPQDEIKVEIQELPAFGDLMNAQSEEAVDEFVKKMTHALDVRAMQERLDHPDNESIQKNLARARTIACWKKTARALLACGLKDGGFVNRVWHDGSYFNVYALSTKLGSLVDTLVDGVALKNAINDAVVTSMFRLENAGVKMDFELAKAAASCKYHVEQAGVRRLLKRHTVGASTAATQAGSTMHMLQAMGVIAFDNRGKNPRYTILDTPQTRRLREVCLAA